MIVLRVRLPPSAARGEEISPRFLLRRPVVDGTARELFPIFSPALPETVGAGQEGKNGGRQSPVESQEDQEGVSRDPGEKEQQDDADSAVVNCEKRGSAGAKLPALRLYPPLLFTLLVLVEEDCQKNAEAGHRGEIADPGEVVKLVFAIQGVRSGQR